MRTVALSALLLAAAPASAAVICNNGGPDATDGNQTVAWVQAEDFTFGAATTVTGAGVYLAGFGGIGTWDGNGRAHAFYLVGEAGVIPEPATWVMLITGFGLVGMAARRRRTALA